MKPTIIDYEYIEKCLNENIPRYGDADWRRQVDLYDLVYLSFSKYIETYYIQQFEKSDFDYGKEELLDFENDNSYMYKNFKLRSDLTKEEKVDLSKLRKKIFKLKKYKSSSNRFNRNVFFNFSPFKEVHFCIKENYKYKITFSLIGFYRNYKLLEILFGKLDLEKLLLKSHVEHYLNYKAMLNLLEESFKEEYVDFLFSNYPEIKDFYVTKINEVGV